MTCFQGYILNPRMTLFLGRREQQISETRLSWSCEYFCSKFCRMESLNLKRSHGVVKVSGLVLCSVGVTVLALYQGPELKSFIHHRLFHHASHGGTNSARKWILGVILQSLAAAMWALWAVLQVYTANSLSMHLCNNACWFAVHFCLL